MPYLIWWQAMLVVSSAAHAGHIVQHLLHQGHIGSITLEAPLLGMAYQADMRQCLEMERQIGRRHVQPGGDLTCHQAMRLALQKETEHLQAHW